MKAKPVERRGGRGHNGTTFPKESPLPRQRKNADVSRYSGRVARRMRTLREQKGWSIEQLWQAISAAGGETTVVSLYSYENGNRKIDPDLYPAIAKALGFKTVGEFLPPK